MGLTYIGGSNFGVFPFPPKFLLVTIADGAKEVEIFKLKIQICAPGCVGCHSNRKKVYCKKFQMVSVSLIPSPPEGYKIRGENTNMAENRVSKGQANCHFSKIKFSPKAEIHCKTISEPHFY